MQRLPIKGRQVANKGIKRQQVTEVAVKWSELNHEGSYRAPAVDWGGKGGCSGGGVGVGGLCRAGVGQGGVGWGII